MQGLRRICRRRNLRQLFIVIDLSAIIVSPLTFSRRARSPQLLFKVTDMSAMSAT